MFFFFSSRRRHTRCGRDWSSDVCSSDLCFRRGRPSAEMPLNGDSSASPHQERAQVVEAAGVIGLATLLSRILGFARDMVLARLFGAGLAADAFFVAYRIPNLLRELFAEGSMSAAFI